MPRGTFHRPKPERDLQSLPSEPANAPRTPGLSVFGAFDGDEGNPTSPQNEGRQEVAADSKKSPPEITHHLGETAGAQGDSSSAKAGRKGLSPEEREIVALLMSHGYSLRQAAARIDRAHTTVSRQLKKVPELAAQVERYRSIAEPDALGEIVQASRKSWRAAAWLLTYLQRRDQMENTEMTT